ncbi:diacylglycerol kinase eta isoform X2 [Hetaerina americana]|uniref:diacylglycerol kinase eta isoform X2 n=1 Tax=Hetaerina americana TaxID=62018 RepID=UPI003A7F5DCC
MEEWISSHKTPGGREYYESGGDSSSSDFLSGRHQWYATSHARPTYCNVCRDALSGVTSHGLSCEVCKMKVHKRCAAKAIANCKWTTLASVGKDIIEDSEGNITMPHQWMEGNLPVSAKCAVCDKTCGSVLRLQDWRCLWCRATVHTQCRPHHPVRCPLGGSGRVSVVPPTALHSIGTDEAWEAVRPTSCSPLLVFVNSKSGDNQGVKFLRRFKQLLNPAQVFDLIQNGPGLGLRLFRHFDPFRILVCSGDGSVGWVLSEIDNLGMHQCQIGVVPLGTGNDLARVLGWGSSVCDGDAHLPQLLEKYEKASTKMLDRWSIMTFERPLAVTMSSRKGKCGELEGEGGVLSGHRELEMGVWESEGPMAAYESVADHLAQILQSDTRAVATASAKMLCDTVKHFTEKMAEFSVKMEEDRRKAKDLEVSAAESSQMHLAQQCQVLNEKLQLLLQALGTTENNGGDKTAASSPPEQSDAETPPAKEENGAEEERKNSIEKQEKEMTNIIQRTSSQEQTRKNLEKQKDKAKHDFILSRADSLKKAFRKIVEETGGRIDADGKRRIARRKSGHVEATRRCSAVEEMEKIRRSSAVEMTEELKRRAELHRKEISLKVVPPPEPSPPSLTPPRPRTPPLITTTIPTLSVENEPMGEPEVKVIAPSDGSDKRKDSTSGFLPIGKSFLAPPSFNVEEVPCESEKPSESFLGVPQMQYLTPSGMEFLSLPQAISPLPCIRRDSNRSMGYDEDLATLPVPSEFADTRRNSGSSYCGALEPEEPPPDPQDSLDPIEIHILGSDGNLLDIDDDEGDEEIARLDLPEFGEGRKLGEGTIREGGDREPTFTLNIPVRTTDDFGDGEMPKTAPIAVEESQEVTPPATCRTPPDVVISAPSPSTSEDIVPEEKGMWDEMGLGGLDVTLPIRNLDLRRHSDDGMRRAATRRISSGCLLKASDAALFAASAPSMSSLEIGAEGRSLDEVARRRSMEVTSSRKVDAKNKLLKKKLPIINPLVRLPMWPNVGGFGIGGGSSSIGAGLISKALLANADALCAAASPLMDPDDTLLEGFFERCVMNNYFGIGIDAKISLDFHNKREEHPKKCRSRAKNYMWYGVLGSKEWLQKTYKNLEQRVQLECDGQRIPLPSLQGIVILNIPSFMGGTNFWGGRKEEDCFLEQSFDDKVLEVVAVFGSVQMAASRLINLQHHRIAQCQSIQITILGEEGVPVQVDGEAWVQPPGIVRIIHKNRMQMLCRNRALETCLRSWEEKQQRAQLQHTSGSTSSSLSSQSSSVKPFSIEEGQLLLGFIESATTLVKCVKLLTISHPSIKAELYEMAAATATQLEKVHPGGKIVEGPDLRLQVTELYNSVQQLHEESCTVLREKAQHLSIREDLETKLSSALSSMERELQHCQKDNSGLVHLQPGGRKACDEGKKGGKAPLFWVKLKRGARGGGSSDGSSSHTSSPHFLTWGTEEVSAWLDRLQLPEYKSTFEKHDIRGKELVALGRRDLKDLGVVKVGHVKRILAAVQDLQQGKDTSGPVE